MGVINSPIWICLTLCHTLLLESGPGKKLRLHHLAILLQLSYIIILQDLFDFSPLVFFDPISNELKVRYNFFLHIRAIGSKTSEVEESKRYCNMIL